MIKRKSVLREREKREERERERERERKKRERTERVRETLHNAYYLYPYALDFIHQI